MVPDTIPNDEIMILYIVYNLTYQIWLEISIHITSYGEMSLQFCDLSSDSVVLGHLRSQNDVITSWLMLTATSNCFASTLDIYKVFEHIYMLFMGIK